MKKFVRFYYRCSFKVCLWVFLSLIALTVLSSSAFAQCTQYTPCTYGDYKYTVSGGTVTIAQYIGAGGNVVIPSTINGMPVIAIGGYYEIDYYWGFIDYYGAFWGRTNVTSVTIPDSVTSIGNGVFFECTGLTSVTIGNGVTSIGDYAFYYCSGLTSVTIPNSVTSIGEQAFYGCSGLTSVTIGNGVTSIGNHAFFGCRGLTSIVVDASNTAYSSQDGVLYDKAKTLLIQCPGRKSGGFTIPDSVTSIGAGAFGFCRSLTSVTIGNGVTSIGNGAFFECTGLTSVTIGNGATSIGAQTFQNCTSLTSVTIPNSVTSIGSYAFAYCRGLTTAYFNGNAPSMGQAVFSVCASNFSICYTAGSTGFTTPKWNGYPAAVCGATLIELASFTATPEAGKVILQWSTETEIDNAGFNLYRSDSADGEYIKINDSLILTQGSSTQGTSYEFIDNDVQNRKTYYYRLEDIDLNGISTMHGPVSATPRLLYGIGK